MRRPLALLTAALFLATLSAPSAAVRQANAQSATQGYYVPASQFATVPFAPPPVADSDAQKNDRSAVLDWQEKRTDADCTRADRTFFVAFDSFWGERSPFAKPLPPEVQSFLDRLDSDIGTAAMMMKDRYQRARPDISRPCPGPNSGMKKGGSYSYPSSHAAISRVFAAVLTAIVPERKTEFFAKADEIGRDRVIIGVHYPTDIVAGNALADLFMAELLKSADYRRDLDRMRVLVVNR